MEVLVLVLVVKDHQVVVKMQLSQTEVVEAVELVVMEVVLVVMVVLVLSYSDFHQVIVLH